MAIKFVCCLFLRYFWIVCSSSVVFRVISVHGSGSYLFSFYATTKNHRNPDQKREENLRSSLLNNCHITADTFCISSDIETVYVSKNVRNVHSQNWLIQCGLKSIEMFGFWSGNSQLARTLTPTFYLCNAFNN